MFSHDYIAGNVFPMKWLKQKLLLDGQGRLKPQHVTFYPTNKCNRNCSWCSCGKEEHKSEMPTSEVRSLFGYLKILGTKAITISGGGEPTIHKDFDNILLAGKRSELKLGLVTNGDAFCEGKLNNQLINQQAEWVRISLSNEMLGVLEHIIEYYIEALPDADKSLSYIVTDETSPDLVIKACKILDKYPEISCIRLGEDAFNPNNQTLRKLKKHIDSPKVLWHYRNNFVKGSSPCYASRLRPAIDPRGYVYPCPCVQYAIPGKLQCLPKETQMCHWTEMANIDYFNGSACQRCFFGDYNYALEYIISPTKHMEFV